MVEQPPKFTCPLDQVDTESSIHFAGKVEGPDEDNHSYRAELTTNSYFGSHWVANKLCTSQGISSGTCTFYCDNKGALTASFGHKRPIPRWASYDLVRHMRTALAMSPIKWIHRHKKGHQDTSTNFQHLTYYTQGNVLADWYASQAHESNDLFNIQQLSQPWSLRVDNEIITGNIHK